MSWRRLWFLRVGIAMVSFWLLREGLALSNVPAVPVLDLDMVLRIRPLEMNLSEH